MSFWEQLALHHNACFAVAIGLVALILTIQLVLLAVGSALGLEAQLDPGEQAPSWIGAALTFLHAQALPGSVAAGVVLLAFGFEGLALTSLARHNGWTEPGLWLAVPLAAGLAVLTTRGVAGLCARLLPLGPPVPSGAQLVGRTARAIKGPVDHRDGQALVLTPAGHRLIVSCQMAPGEPPAPAGAEVVLASYDAPTHRFVCRPTSP